MDKNDNFSVIAIISLYSPIILLLSAFLLSTTFTILLSRFLLFSIKIFLLFKISLYFPYFLLILISIKTIPTINIIILKFNFIIFLFLLFFNFEMAQSHIQKPLPCHYPSNIPIQNLDTFLKYYSQVSQNC